jgi:uracil-DNA glycosylase family 4
MILKPASCKGCPLYEKPHGKTWGFSVPVGTGRSGVMIVAEALGEAEEKEGMALVGKSGYTLFQQLKRIDIERDNFTIFNTIACRPPDNKLVGMPYMQGAIAHCKPNLDAAVQQAKRIAGVEGKTFVIVTLGVTPFKAILKLDGIKDRELLKKDYYAYPFWSDTYGCWVLNAPHPAYLYVETRTSGQSFSSYLSEHWKLLITAWFWTSPTIFLIPIALVLTFGLRVMKLSLGKDPDNPLSYDIETPYKKKVKDEEEIGKEEDADHTILRISFSYVDSAGVTHTVSVKWSAEYVAGIERLFDLANFVLGWNSDKYDYPRVSRHVKVRGIGLDGMVAWHILNSSLPKALGFVTPYYWQKTGVWKYLADSQPAYYNAKDADAALRNFIGIKRDLIANKLWHVYERHWIELAKALKFMSGTGVLRDNEMRDAAEKQLQATLDLVEASMEEAVPLEARELKIYKKKPRKESPEKSH